MPEAYDPELLVEFAFGSTWSDPTSGYSWSDETAYCARIGPIVRGRPSELDEFSPGTCTLELDTTDRRFDPLNAAGPLYGQLVPGVPVRVTAELNAVTYPLFYGYVQGWRMRAGTFQSTVEVPCIDALGILADLTLPRSVYELEVLADDPVLYLGLGQDGTAAVDKSGNGRDGVYTGPIEQAAPSLVPFGDGAVRLPEQATQGVVAVSRTDARVLAPPRTASIWLENLPDEIPSSETVAYWIAHQADADGDQSWTIRYFRFTPSIFLSVRSGDTAPDNLWEFSSAAQVLEGSTGPHHLFVVMTTTDVRVWLDGVELQPSDTDGLAAIGAPDGVYLGDPRPGTENPDQERSWVGSYDEFALFDTALSETRLRAHRDAALRPWFGDLPGVRAGRYLDELGWPADLRALDAGEVPFGNADPNGDNALSHLQLIAASEQGRWFASAAGELTLHGNARTITGTPAVTITAGDGTVLLEGLTFSLDDTFRFDAAEVQRKYGAVQRVLAPGVTTPSRVRSIGGLLARDDRIARTVAGRIVWRYGTARTRLQRFTLQPQQDPTLWPAILGLELGDVVRLQATPEGTGDPIVLDVFVESLEHEPTDNDWLVHLQGSPVDDTDYLTIGGDGATQGIGTGAIR